MADGVVQIHVTHPDRQALGRLVDKLVESHAIASANIAGPLASTYYWNGKSEHAEDCEVLRRDELLRRAPGAAQGRNRGSGRRRGS